jgi:hypothetical protein
MTTVHPAAASVRAVASPIPEVAPTIHATLSFNTGVPLIARTQGEDCFSNDAPPARLVAKCFNGNNGDEEKPRTTFKCGLNAE